MFPRALENQRQQLYADTSEGLGRRLQRVREPAEMFAAIRWGLDQLEATYAATPAKELAKVACGAGCGVCCSVPVDVQAHEVFFSAEFIQLNFSPAALAGVIERTAAHRAEVAVLDETARYQRMHPCALLSAEGNCTIYEGRPEICRAHHSTNAKICAAHVADPAVDPSPDYIPVLRARMFAVMLGMDAAIEAAGYDDRAYDFGSALHEALTNSLCRVRWLRRERAFPESCLAFPHPSTGE
ncbi:MAG: YkgJ family cysteine cluster protein [Candidatus Didemnitutus sp.]|nr:YkgJ family cysteine cluster protein [Candidatus Didemnitutus sp.]